jgi:hypothetical protein
MLEVTVTKQVRVREFLDLVQIETKLPPQS